MRKRGAWVLEGLPFSRGSSGGFSLAREFRGGPCALMRGGGLLYTGARWSVRDLGATGQGRSVASKFVWGVLGEERAFRAEKTRSRRG